MQDTTGARADAIELLTSHHREVEQLWSQLEVGGPGSSITAENARRIVQLLSQHDAIETQLLYPAVRKADGGDPLADHSLEDHQRIRELLKEVDTGDPTTPEIFAKLGEAIQAVQRHVQEEETVVFPRLRKELSGAELDALGEKMAAAMKVAPTHPHPTTPNNPIGAAVAGAVTGVVDRVKDAVTGKK